MTKPGHVAPFRRQRRPLVLWIAIWFTIAAALGGLTAHL